MTDPLAQARATIAEALKTLEVETGTIVRSLGLRRMEATTIGDDRRRHLMTVEIELERLPGHDWQTGQPPP